MITAAVNPMINLLKTSIRERHSERDQASFQPQRYALLLADVSCIAPYNYDGV